MTPFNSPTFTLPQSLQIVSADRVNVENWLRFGLIIPAGDAPGRARRFSLADLVRIEIMSFFRELGVEVRTGAVLANLAVEDFAPHADEVAGRTMFSDGPLVKSNFGWSYGLVRDADGTLRAADRDDPPEDMAAISVPIGMLAQRVFLKAKGVMAQAKDADE